MRQILGLWWLVNWGVYWMLLILIIIKFKITYIIIVYYNKICMSKEDYKVKENYEELKNGPVDNRECRDILCCLLFIAASIVLSALFIYSVAEGKPEKLMTPFDSNYPVYFRKYSASPVRNRLRRNKLPVPVLHDPFPQPVQPHGLCIQLSNRVLHRPLHRQFRYLRIHSALQDNH
jgi:hypothetical protein